MAAKIDPLLKKMFNGYREAALWASTDDDGEPLDERFSVSDFSSEANATMLKDCADFLADNADDIAEFQENTSRSLEDVGHDFFLTRNGHGVGFWDRTGGGAAGQRLSKASEKAGTQDVYVGDDEELHVTGGVRSNPRRNTAAPAGEGPRIRITYSVYTPESVEEGGEAEHGWIDEEGVSMRPDRYDQEEGLTVVDVAFKFLLDEGVVETSSSEFHKGVWYIGKMSHDYSTGEDTEKHYHLVGFSQAQEREIYDRLRRRAVFPPRRR